MNNAELEARLTRLEAAVAAIQARLPPKQDETGEAALPVPVPVPVAPVEVAREEPQPGDDLWKQVGRAVLIVGGAYVLRALTETAVISEMTGVVLGLVYALFWIWRGQAPTAALIAGALIWEATARFGILTGAAASSLVLIAALALMLRAVQKRSIREALLASVMTALTCLGIAIVTQEVVPPLLAIAAAGLAMAWVSIELDAPPYLTLLLGFGTDMLALVVALLAPSGSMASVGALLAVVAMGVVTPLVLRVWGRERDVRWPELVQAVAATVVGLGGAMWVSRSMVVVVAGFVVALFAYGAVFVRARVDCGAVATALAACGAIGVVFATLATLRPSALALVWAFAGLAAAVVARRWSWGAMDGQAVCWSVAAAIAAGALTALVRSAAANPLPLLAVGALALLSLWWGNRDAHGLRLALLAVVTTTASLVALSLTLRFVVQTPAGAALTRTFLLAVAAVVLYAISPLITEARTIARVVLVIGGLKLIVEDLRTSPAMLVVLALAAYGGALTFVASRRSSAAGPVS